MPKALRGVRPTLRSDQSLLSILWPQACGSNSILRSKPPRECEYSCERCGLASSSWRKCSQLSLSTCEVSGHADPTILFPCFTLPFTTSRLLLSNCRIREHQYSAVLLPYSTLFSTLSPIRQPKPSKSVLAIRTWATRTPSCPLTADTLWSDSML